MTFTYPQAVERLVNRPLLITPLKAQTIFGVLRDRASWDATLDIGEFGDDLRAEDPKSNRRAGPSIDVAPRLRHAAYVGERLFPEIEGIAIIRIRGTLVQRNGLDAFSGMTGYDGIAAKIDAAISDDGIRGILLDIDSPGGEVAGCFDLADRIFDARGEKPVWAICAEDAYSAAYAIASQADQIIVPRTGGVGSVGVVLMHTDVSQWLADAGITVTLIHAGAHKVDGNPYEPLSDDIHAELQSEIDTCRTMFADIVARGRDMNVENVLKTEARCLSASRAIKAGFADAIMAPDDGLAAFIDALNDLDTTD